MPDLHHVELAKSGRETITRWRADNPETVLELSGADLSDSDLQGVRLGGANLEGADLSDAVLSRASQPGVNFSGANLAGVGVLTSTGFGLTSRAPTWRARCCATAALTASPSSRPACAGLISTSPT